MTETFSLVPLSLLSDALAIEQAGYPADEAASRATLEYRLSNAPDLFYGVFDAKKQLIGFICGTASTSSLVTESSFTTHVPESKTVCIHSVVVRKEFQNHGLGGNLVRSYVGHLRKLGYERAALLAHEKLIPFYKQCGFTLVGESEVVHGKEKWYNLSLDLKGKKRWEDLVAENPGIQQGDVPHDVRCKREGCRSLILKKGSGSVVKRIDRLTNPTSRSTTAFMVQSPLTFENIGFSKDTVLPSAASGAPQDSTRPIIKYLTCADCDYGPIGWCETGGRDLGREVDEEVSGTRKGAGSGIEYLIKADEITLWID